MMEHTPGPWKYVKQGPHWNNPALERIEIQHGNDGECIADTVYEEADARFIVTACNNFEEMRHALEMVVRDLDNRQLQSGTICVREIARDVLSKLEGAK